MDRTGLAPGAAIRRRACGAALLGALLLAAAAPLWHRHDEVDAGRADHDRACAVCAAMLTPGAPPPPAEGPPAPGPVQPAGASIREQARAATPTVLPPARGPPGP
jgi:hypothetical protein